MSDKVFLQILNMSYTAGFVIIFVMIARLFLKKAPKVFSYMLWSVVLFRLICPFSFDSIWSLLPSKTTSFPIHTYSQTPQIAREIAVLDSMAKPALPVATPVVNANPLQRWIIIGEIIWLIGIAVILLYSAISLLRLRWKLVGAVKLCGNIYLADHITSPFVIGVMRPKIYLPSILSEQEQSYIILHEQTHIRRLDHIVKLLAFAALTVHWFNPLVWVGFILFGNDMEMSCDESVMKHMDTDIRSNYSTLLLSLATGRKVITGMPLAFCEGDIKSRIKNIMKYKRSAFWVVIVTLIAVIIIVTGLAANPRTGKASMQWAKKLKVSDVEKIELVKMPSEEKERYQQLDNSEFSDIVTLINKSQGKYIKNPEEMSGSSITFNITLTNGKKHYVCNSVNNYLIIDGDYYDAGYNWLSSWNYPGNSMLPIEVSDKNENGEKMLTIDELKIIAQKGKNITWDDFSKFKGTEIGSGLYIRKYDINEQYYVLIGGTSPNKAPMYVSLHDTRAGRSIAVGEDNIDDFIRGSDDSKISSDSEDMVIDNIGSVIWYLRKYQGTDTKFLPVLNRYEIVREELNPDKAKLTVIEDKIWNVWDKWNNILTTTDRFIYLAAKDDEDVSIKSPVLVSSARDGSDRRIYGAPYNAVNQLTMDDKTEKIYFTGWTNDQTFPQPLYRTDEKLEKVSGMRKLNGWLIKVYDDKAYYFSSDKKHPGIYRVPVSGTKKPELIDKVKFVAENYTPVIYSEINIDESGKMTSLKYTLKKRGGDVKGQVSISN